MPEKKPDNIVKKVFERSAPAAERVSAIFTHYGKQKKSERAVFKVPKTEKPRDPHFSKLPAAVDFGVTDIKFLQLAKTEKGDMQTVAMDREVYGAATGDTYFRSKEALNKILSRNRGAGQKVIVGLPSRELLAYNFTFPALGEDELREAVKWKLKQIKPFNLEDEKLRYSILRWDSPVLPGAPAVLTSPASQQRITVICASTENIIRKTAMLEAEGMKAVSIQGAALALVHIRSFGVSTPLSEEVVVWLDLGSEESVFIVEKKGHVYFMRNLTVTGKSLAKQVAEGCKVTEKDAELLKQKYGLESWKPELRPQMMTDAEKAADPAAAVCFALLSTLENLVIDIEHSFKYFSYQVTQSQVQKFDRIILAGTSSNLKKLEDFLSDRLSVPVQRADAFPSARIVSQDPLGFAPAAGLSVSPFVSEGFSLDLLAGSKKSVLPWRLRAQKLGPRAIAILAGVFIFLSILPEVGSVLVFKGMAQEEAKKLKMAREELSRRQSSQLYLAEEEKQLLEEKTMLENRLSLLRRSGSNRRPFSSVLAKLASIMPEDIWVTKLSYAEKLLTLVGSTSKNESIVAFLEKLKEPREFSDVTFDYTQRDPRSAVFSFQVMMSVK